MASKLLDEDRESLFAFESVHSRATSIGSSRILRVLLQLLGIVFLVVVIALLAVMVSRRDGSVTNAVRHLFLRAIDEKLPVIPSDYSGVSPTLILIVGDAWAAGLGVSDTAQDAWWTRLRDIPIIRRTNESARLADVPSQIASAHLPTAMQSVHLAVVVQAGWNDLVHAQLENRLEDLNLDALVNDSITRIRSLATQLFSKTASLSIYFLDYPDCTCNTGYTQITCEPPLNQIYNHPSAVSLHLRALSMLSHALLARTHLNGVAFIPLRYTLKNIGSSESVEVSQTKEHAPIGVNCKRLPDPIPPAFDSKCGLMGVNGQRYQADLVAAYLTNKFYCHVG